MGGGNSKSKKEYKVLLLGLDNAGKTSILYRMKRGQVVQTNPTIGFNSETILYRGRGFLVWDIAGQENLRSMWKHYFSQTDALIFVVDSTDIARLEVAATELNKVLDVLADVPLLVYANKQDLPEALSVNAVIEKLRLKELVNRKWIVQASSSLQNQGLLEGVDWLSDVLSSP